MSAYSDLCARIAMINDLLCSASVLTWDARTMMPAGGVETRGLQIGTLKQIARDMLVADETRRLSERARGEISGRDDAELELRALDAIDHGVAHHSRIPAELLARQAALVPVAGAAWAQARASGDFARFLPYLAQTVEQARRMADAIGFDDHPYDAMVSIFEPGETARSLASFFGTLRAGIAPILDAARSRPEPRRDFLFRHFPEERQRALSADLAALAGYDLARGRIDKAVHPFEVSFTRNDVRITTRYYENFLPASLFGTLHEAGHARYEQGVAPHLTRTVFATDLVGLYAVGGTSFGAHESQSRLVENHVGRSARFWDKNFALVQSHFPDALGDVSAREFAAAVNHVEPGLIRVEADELTYDLHIMLRVDIEMALMDGSLAPRDVPEAWNAAVMRDLGLAVPDDGKGCLQDVHWSSGYIGSFPTYTIGNAMAAQIMEALAREDDISGAMENGDYAPLFRRLEASVWSHGRSRSRDELLTDLTGQPLHPDAYLGYLSGKFG